MRILDQRHLPEREEWIEAATWEQVAEAIREMAVRGAPLIGVAAAYGLALARRSGADEQAARRGLAETRPTAANLSKALARVARADDPLAEAEALHEEERRACEAIGRHGASLVPEDAVVLTICSTGSLAAPGIGTALGVIRTAHREGKLKEAVLLETRPRLQGLRLNAWELLRDGVPFRVIPDGAAAWWMDRMGADLVITGADRIAANGDTANKIGTYALALAANEYGVTFAVAAPTSTIDRMTPTGDEIPIEERPPEEVTRVRGVAVAPEGCPVWNPAFDVTPAPFINRIVTEGGVHSPPYDFAKSLSPTWP